jgi:hypothetical protein
MWPLSVGGGSRGREMRETLLDRRRDAARKLAISESQVLKFERQGLQRAIRVPGIRAVRYDARDVEALAKRWIDGEGA